jgi:thiol-disulfide isomerase/thioredoxin
MTAPALRRLALIPLLATLASASGPGGEELGWVKVSRDAIPFDIEKVGGGRLTEKVFDGKVVVIDFWATWCAPCVRELPELLAFEEKIRDRKDVLFLSFSVDDEKEDIVKFFEGRKERFPVYLASALADRMDVTLFPTKVIIDGRVKPARIRLAKEGVVETKELEDRVAEVLKSPPEKKGAAASS